MVVDFRDRGVALLGEAFSETFGVFVREDDGWCVSSLDRCDLDGGGGGGEGDSGAGRAPPDRIKRSKDGALELLLLARDVGAGTG